MSYSEEVDREGTDPHERSVHPLYEKLRALGTKLDHAAAQLVQLADSHRPVRRGSGA